MAITWSNRVEGVTASGRRSVTMDFSAPNGTADDLTKATIGLRDIDEVWLKLATASGVAIDITANDSTKVTVDPSGIGTGTVVFIGHD